MTDAGSRSLFFFNFQDKVFYNFYMRKISNNFREAHKPPQDQMRDRRQQKRVVVEVLNLNGKIMCTNNVKVLNISSGGISIKADRRLNIGSSYLFKLEDKGEVLTIRGTVVYSKLRESRQGSNGDIVPVYVAGLKFTTVSDEKKINDIINFMENRQ